MRKEMTSKERMLSAISYKETDYIPCSFMMFHGLRDRLGKDQYRFIDAQIELGLDTVAELPEFPVSPNNEVVSRVWKTHDLNEPYPILHKEYDTPGGIMSASVKQTEDWPHGDEVQFYCDFNVPRFKKAFLENRADLKALRYMLAPPSLAEIRAFREESRRIKEYAQQKGIMVRGVRGVLMDAAIRFAGVQNLIFAAIEDPGYLEEMMDIISNWNIHRMEIVLDEKPDMFLRRAWYENMSFWSPEQFRKFMKPYLVKEVQICHEAGVKFGYINTCSYMDILDDFIEIGIDVLIGIDPVEDKRLDMKAVKAKLMGKVSLWGGASGFVTVENGTEKEIRDEVGTAIRILSPGGGFILSPVDNVRSTSDKAIENAKIFIDEWNKLKGKGK